MLFVRKSLFLLFMIFFLQTNVHSLSNKNTLEKKNSEFFYTPIIAPISDIVESPNISTEFFQLQSNLNIFILDFSNLEEQGHTMNRLALLIEASNAPKDLVVNDQEMRKLVLETNQNIATLYLGHDVETKSLARFFNLALKNDIQLNQHEYKLKNTLLKNQILSFNDGIYHAIENKVLVTISKIQKDNPSSQQDETITKVMRQYILQHEISHGEYFTNKEYSYYCQEFWKKNLNDAQRESFRDYLDNKYYDKNQEDLMINEFQAYLVYTGTKLSDLFDKGKLKNMTVDEVVKIRNNFILGSPSSLPVIYKD